jgi:hypothetical protein
MKTPIRHHLFKLLAALSLCSVLLPSQVQAIDSGETSAANWTEAQIRSRISELEAERNMRLGLPQENPITTLIADPQTWIIGITTTLAVGGTGILWLLFMMRRLKNKNWQPTIMGDWEPEAPAQSHAKIISSPNKPVLSAPSVPSAIKPPTANLAATVQLRTAPPAGNRGLTKDGNSFNAIEYVAIALPATAKIIKTADLPVVSKPETAVTLAATGAVPAHLASSDTEDLLLSAEEDEQLDLRSPAAAAIELNDDIPPLEQARYWASFNKPDVAIEILEQTCDRNEVPNSWILLLDLYLQTGKQSEYEVLRLEFKEIYNAKVPCWADALTPLPPKSLKDMPDLMQRINKMLPSNGIVSYLKDFLFDDREGKRQGFEFGVYRDLLTLFNAVSNGKNVSCCEAICH